MIHNKSRFLYSTHFIYRLENTRHRPLPVVWNFDQQFLAGLINTIIEGGCGACFILFLFTMQIYFVFLTYSTLFQYQDQPLTYLLNYLIIDFYNYCSAMDNWMIRITIIIIKELFSKLTFSTGSLLFLPFLRPSPSAPVPIIANLPNPNKSIKCLGIWVQPLESSLP